MKQPLFRANLGLTIHAMGKLIDIKHKDNAVNSGQNGDGSRTRHSFTLSLILTIALAGFAFYHLLGRTTDDAGSRLNIDVRPAADVYTEAASMQTQTLRLRALRNFSAAYPDSPQAQTAAEEIKALETEEHDAWTSVSEVYYDVMKSAEVKRETLDAFKAAWGGGNYSEEILIMEGRFEDAAPKNRTLNENTGRPPGLVGSDIKLPDHATQKVQSAAISDDALAGDLPMAKTFPIPMAETIPVPKETVIGATVMRDSKPRYPSRAQRRGEEGDVTVAMDIGIDGKVIDARVVKAASGRYSSDFGKAAMRAARRTRFNPKTVNGEPAPENGYTRIYRFRLAE